MLWFTLLCMAGFAASLALIIYRQPRVSRRLTDGLVHGALWILVWSLAYPPAWQPPATTITLPTDAAARAALLADQSAAQMAAIEAAHLPGSGLTRNALLDFPPLRLQLAESSAADAWVPSWNRDLVLGQPLELRLTLTAGGDTAKRLALEDPFGNTVDSGLLSADNPQLVLRDRPKLVGQWEYRVRVEPVAAASDAGPRSRNPANINGARSEVLPVVVHAPQKPKVLVWLARPGFESAALSRWLRQTGTPAQVVTQLAPEMARREVFNDLPLRKSGLLEADTPFDLLILDSRLWPQLSSRERQQLRAIASNKSLLWLVHDASGKDFMRYARAEGMPLQENATADVHYTPASDPGSIAFPQLTLTALGAAAHDAGDTRIVADEREIYWANIHPQQSLGFIFFRNSYRWQTAGFASEFAQMWSNIFARQLTWRGGRPALAINPELPQVTLRTRVCSDNLGGTDLAALVRQPGKKPATRDEFLPVIHEMDDSAGHCFSFWPQKSGWHTVGSDFSVYVFEKDSWPEWQAHRARSDAAQMASARLGTNVSATVNNPLPRYWPALALLILLTLLWWRERPAVR